MVHPIQAPIARMAVKAINTGIATSQILMASRAGQKSATMYEIATAKQAMKISQPIPWSFINHTFHLRLSLLNDDVFVGLAVFC